MITTLEKGQIVALSLKEGAAPRRSYVGEIQEVDDRGIRVTQWDWIMGAPLGFDYYFAWDQITSSLICTTEHEAKGFLDQASAWQEKMELVRAG